MQVTIASLSEANENERIDSQFFRPEYVDSYNVVINSSHDTLSKIAHITDGNHLKIAENYDNADGVRYLRGQDLSTDMMLHDRNIIYIPESCFDSLERSHIYKNDILITIVGANTGLVGLVYDPPKKLVANCKLGIARADKNKILPGYLYSFLTGRYGRHQLLRSIRGGGQTGLILPDMRQLRITRLTSEFESTINDLVLKGHSKIFESKDIYSNVQTILLSELGLVNWKPKHQLTFVKNYSATEQARRVDAEYYQPKYDELLQLIDQNSKYTNLISDILIHNARGLQPKYSSDGSLDVITSKHILEDGLDFDNFDKTDLTNWNVQKKARVKKGNILTYTTGANIGRTAIYQSDKQALASNHVNILTIEEEDPEYVAFVMNSLIGRLQTERLSAGSAQAELYPQDIGNFVIPFIKKEKQTQIQQKVNESFNLRKQSKHLLEYAKQAVEVAIEQDEQTAINWLEKQMKFNGDFNAK